MQQEREKKYQYQCIEVSNSFKQIKKIFKNEIIQLEEWSSTQFKNILFDSSICEYSQFKSIFDESVLNKNHLVIFINTELNGTLGGYIETSVSTIGTYISDPNAFLFILIVFLNYLLSHQILLLQDEPSNQTKSI